MLVTETLLHRATTQEPVHAKGAPVLSFCELSKTQKMKVAKGD